MRTAIKRAYVNNFDSFSKVRAIADYDNIHAVKGTIQKAPIDDIEVWVKIKEAIDVADNDNTILSPQEFSDKYHMIVIRFEGYINGEIKQSFLIALFSYLMMNNKKRATIKIKVVSVSNKSAEYYLGYYSVFLLSLISFSLLDIVDLITLVLLMIALGIVYIKNGLFFMTYH